MKIRTEHVSGTPTAKIRAKGAGKQRTIMVQEATPAAHGEAAGELALVLGLSWNDGITADHNEEKTKFGFSF